jgi:hypothetical protein
VREYQATAVVDDEGELEVQLKTDLPAGFHRLRLYVEDDLTDEQREMLRVRAELGVFCADWDRPEDRVYDDL